MVCWDTVVNYLVCYIVVKGFNVDYDDVNCCVKQDQKLF